MARKNREDFRLKETERIWDAVKRTNTHVKDYSMTHLITVIWEPLNHHKRTRRLRLSIGSESWVGYSKPILDAVNRLLEDSTEDAWLSVMKLRLDNYHGKEMVINTTSVNRECLRDHVAEVSLGKNKAIVDLEELLKATRYA